MYLRLSVWLALFTFASLGAVRAQAPSPADAAMQPGQIVAKQVTGEVLMTLNGTTTPLHNDDRVSQSATLVTRHDSSVILVFSNGATTQLGGDTTLSIEEFLQDPFSQDINVGALATEPTRSHTRLRLTKGELLGKVAHLRIDEGSSFTVDTPVGAAGIRGTTFRIVFRPSGTGQAFAVFSLSTVEGNVHFQQGSTTAAPPPAPGQPPPAPGTAAPSGVAVTGGQEVVVTVSVNVNAQTGQVAVTAPPVITATQPISIQTQAALVQQVQALVTTAAATTFTPPPAPATSGASGTSSGSTSADKKDSSSQSSGGDSSTTASTATSSASGSSSTPADQSTAAAANQAAQAGGLGSPAPGVTSPAPTLTPLAGKGTQ